MKARWKAEAAHAFKQLARITHQPTALHANLVRAGLAFCQLLQV